MAARMANLPVRLFQYSDTFPKEGSVFPERLWHACNSSRSSVIIVHAIGIAILIDFTGLKGAGKLLHGFFLAVCTMYILF